MRTLWRGLVFALAVVAPLSAPAPASAHPLGNFTVNAAAALTVSQGRLKVAYALDLAEIPAFQEIGRMDADGDGAADGSELQAWASARAANLVGRFRLEVDGRPIPLETGSAEAALSPGQGGLDILRLDAVFAASVPGAGSVRFIDRNDQGRLGWREITATGADGTAVTRSSVPASSPSDHLRSYPADLLSSPPTTREARFAFGPGSQEPGELIASGSTERPGGSGSALDSFVGRRSLSFPIILLALLVAFAVGALHALAPGHGKTVTVAYLAGGSARARDALGVGIAVAVMHTATVVALGLLLVFASTAFPAERLYPWLGVFAGAAAMLLGVGLLLSRIRHDRSHRRGHGHEHSAPVSRPGLAALALSGGLLPSPTAVIVLLGSFSVGRAPFGLALVAAFGAGLAAAVTGIGIIALRARELAVRRLPARLTRAIPVAGAGAIATMGLVIAARGIAQL